VAFVPAFQPPAGASVRALLQAAHLYLKSRDIVHPDWHAELIVGGILGMKRHELYLKPDRSVTGGELSTIRAALTRRAGGEPTQYVLGTTEFYGLPFRCDKRALIPRPETEHLVELAARRLRSLPGAPRVADVGTGSGCIAVALAVEAPSAVIVATDVDQGALALARENAELNGATERITFLLSDLFASLEGPFDMVVANLPYVSPAERPHLAPEVRDFEPTGALFAEEDGLLLLRRVIREAPPNLSAGGCILLEIGYDQAEAVREACLLTGAYADIELHPDYQGHLRVLTAVKM
jgi:release factor glutamine methyltransferase